MRPFVHVNCAMSADGKIAGADRTQVRISSDEDIQRVKALRKEYDGILVGVGTVVADDPHLTVKGLDRDENPLRIVLDPNGRVPDDALVLNDAADTVIVTSEGCARSWDDVDVIRAGKDRIDLPLALEEMAKMGVESILVEGGGETIASFFREGLVDRYSVFIGSLVIGGRTSPTPIDGDGWIRDVELRMISSETLGNGVLLTFDVTARAR